MTSSWYSKHDESKKSKEKTCCVPKTSNCLKGTNHPKTRPYCCAMRVKLAFSLAEVKKKQARNKAKQSQTLYQLRYLQHDNKHSWCCFESVGSSTTVIQL